MVTDKSTRDLLNALVTDAGLTVTSGRGRWEYQVKRLAKKANKQQTWLNVQGDLGWELVSVDGGKAYLRRPTTN